MSRKLIRLVKKEKKFYKLDFKKHGIGGYTYTMPKERKQDKKFISGVMYTVVFFPKVKGIGNAQWWTANAANLSQTKEAAVIKFMDSIAKTANWQEYAKAGHKVRKVKIIDLGDT